MHRLEMAAASIAAVVVVVVTARTADFVVSPGKKIAVLFPPIVLYYWD